MRQIKTNSVNINQISINKINGTTNIVGLLGWPVKHTFSPLMHNAAFAALDLNWAYIPLPIVPEQIKKAVPSLQAFNFKGANVTIPHKQTIIPYLDKVDHLAKLIGAVNTIVIKKQVAYGYNTDSYGFLKSLTDANFDAKGSRCLILGAGGAARAIAFSLADARADTIAIYNRTKSRASLLVNELENIFSTIKFSSQFLSPQVLKLSQTQFDLVINTTSMGMFPDLEATPWPLDIALPQAVICDLVYNPIKTQFLKQAETVGLKTIDGLGMLIHQGAKAFEIWTDQTPPTDLMRQIILKEMERGT